jgi:glucan phosphoethanolaminetransferase (alkaline phosphatase superfamily)
MWKNEYVKRGFEGMLIILALFCIFNTLESSANWREVSIFFSTDDYAKGIIYWLSYLAVLVSIFILVFHTNRKVNVFIFSLLFISILIDCSYRTLNGIGLTYEDALIAFQNIGFDLEGEVFKTYYPTIISAAGIAFIIVNMIFGLRYFFKRIRFQKLRYLIVPTLTFVGVIYIIYISNANRLSYPIPYKVPALLFYVSQKGLYSGERDSVYFAPKYQPVAKHIVWIIDESVRPDILQINDFSKKTTPFLDSIQDSILNYGIASSGSVCSDYSHIMLMSGLKVNELPDIKGIARKKPTIFQYAKHNGIQSNLLYAPSHEDVPKGYMTQSDFNHIDHRFHTKKIYPDVEPYLIDFKSIDILEKIIDTQERSFTYFLKYGCHFHYESTYPPAHRYFEPIQDIASWKRDNRDELLNSYYNSIRWEVDHFFEVLYKRFKGQDILFIYTSDHGQHLMEYSDIKMTHCIKKAAPHEMAMVPLFFLPMNHSIKTELKSVFRNENVNKASHFNIFPSTLILMGYDSKEVHEQYGNSLFDSLETSERIFISGDIFGRSKAFINKFTPVLTTQ